MERLACATHVEPPDPLALSTVIEKIKQSRHVLVLASSPVDSEGAAFTSAYVHGAPPVFATILMDVMKRNPDLGLAIADIVEEEMQK